MGLSGYPTRFNHRFPAIKTLDYRLVGAGRDAPIERGEQELSDGQWAVIEPEVILPVEEVWPVSTPDRVPDDASPPAVPTIRPPDLIAEGRALGVA